MSNNKQIKTNRLFELLSNLYSENTVLGIIALALIAFFANVISPQLGSKINSGLLPLFILVALLELYFLRIRTDSKLNEVLKNKKEGKVFKTFVSGNEFDEYLKSRFETANSLKIIHFSSFGIYDTKQQKRYIFNLRRFVKKGGKLSRIISATNNKDFYTWAIKDLEFLNDYDYNLYYLKEMKISDIRIMALMIIDDNEVYLGSPHLTKSTFSVLGINDRNSVLYFNEYFQYLVDKSIVIKSSHTNNVKILNAAANNI